MDDLPEPQPLVTVIGAGAAVTTYGLFLALLFVPMAETVGRLAFWSTLVLAAVALVCGLIHRRRPVKFALVLSGLTYLVIIGPAPFG